MTTLKLTAKRQATLPKELCEEMHLEPGNAIEVESREIDGRRAWVLFSPKPPSLSWVGSLARFGKGKHLSMDAIRQRIGEAMAHGDLD